MGDLKKLRELVFAADNKACFIERERILNRLQGEMADYNEPDKYALILSKLLSEVSTPVLDCDYFAGHVVEALPDEGMSAPNFLLHSVGHMSFDYAKVLKLGLKGILAEIQQNAEKKGDQASLDFAKNAGIVVYAIRDYAERYAKEAKKKGFIEMAEALSHVPFEPAYDYYSALQSIWLVHMIASCYVGSRDYAFGRFDAYMLPFYEKALADGHSKEELTELLAGFFMKANEICGRTAHNYQSKPVLCQASKQYVNIGGETVNAFSYVVLEAAKRNDMAQPEVIVLLKSDVEESFKTAVCEALAVLTGKMNTYNYDLVVQTLIKKGIPEEIAKDVTYSACCTLDLNYHSFRLEYFAPAPEIFVQVLHEKEYESLDELVKAYTEGIRQNVQEYVNRTQRGFGENESRRQFVLDSILLSDSAAECHYACDGNAKYNVMNIFCSGVATIGDSLMVLDKLVFQEKRYTYREFADILKNNYESDEILRKEIQQYVRFGNDTANDAYAVLAGNAFMDAIDALETRANFYAVPSFYSLSRENDSCAGVGATPDGRKAGEPYSENQSPTYGADKNGITALLKSIAKLPFYRTGAGGLNLSFTQNVAPEILKALIVSYFAMGGIHVGISVLDHDTLKDAMVNPERYQSLTVRLYGFSEYFIALPKWQQLAVLNRTGYTI